MPLLRNNLPLSCNNPGLLVTSRNVVSKGMMVIEWGGGYSQDKDQKSPSICPGLHYFLVGY